MGQGLQWAQRKLPQCPKENWLTVPPQFINSWGSSGVIRTGTSVGIPGNLQSWLSWESDPWGLCLRGQSLLRCGPLQTRHGHEGLLRCLKAIPLKMPLLSTVITSLSLFTWVPLGIFLRLFQSGSNSHCWGFSLLPGSFLPPRNLYHNIPSKPAATALSKDWFSPNAYFNSLQQISGADWVRNISFKIISPSAFSGSTSVNFQRTSHSLSRNLPGVSFSPCSMSANLA